MTRICTALTRPSVSRRRSWVMVVALVVFMLGLTELGALSVRAEDPVGTWQIWVADDFSGGVGARWLVTDTSTLDGGIYTWDSAAFTATSPITSAWAVGGGVDGSALAAGQDVYPVGVDSWLIYGPVDLTQHVRARASFNWWLDSAEGDMLSWCVLTEPAVSSLQDVQECGTTRWSGPIAAWVHAELDLDTKSPGAEATYVAFRFTSDDDPASGLGAFLDDFTISVAGPATVYLPFVRRDPTPTPMAVVLRNGGFEEDWETESSTRCVIYYTDGRIEDTTRNNIQTPPGWVTWYRSGMPVEHDPDNYVGWAQPEVTSVNHHDPDRMVEGEMGERLFTFYRIHDGGFYQQLAVAPGMYMRFSAWAHAWSNLGESSLYPSNPEWSEGAHVGFLHFSALTGTPELDEGDRNFTFWVGIDPTGGTNPFADTVVWGQGVHIYNGYVELPYADAVARSSTITVFLRSQTLWPFKHNDAYWDAAHLQSWQ